MTTARRALPHGLAALALASLAGCGSGAADVTADPSSSASATASTTTDPATAAPEPSTSPSTAPPARGTSTQAVYYLVDTRSGVRLQREFRQVHDSVTPVQAAVEFMLREPALDRDYSSLWPRTTTVRGIVRNGATATVDLSGDALKGQGGAEATSRTVQQLVHTVTAADTSISGVRILAEGREVDDFWGHLSLAGKTFRRESHVEVMAFVSIDNPNEGTEVRRTFTLTGTATVFEANVQWKVTRGCPADVTCVGDKQVYAQGFTTATAGAPSRGSWSVQVSLPPEVLDTSGFVEITAFEESAEDGSVRAADTKVVRVVA